MKKLANIYVRGCVGEVDEQLKEVRIAAQRLGVEINMECIDINKSAHDHDRAGYQQLIADIEQEKINMIIVKDFEKFHRDTLKLVNFMKFIGVHKINIFLTSSNSFFSYDLYDVKLLRALAFNESQKWLK